MHYSTRCCIAFSTDFSSVKILFPIIIVLQSISQQRANTMPDSTVENAKLKAHRVRIYMFFGRATTGVPLEPECKHALFHVGYSSASHNATRRGVVEIAEKFLHGD